MSPPVHAAHCARTVPAVHFCPLSPAAVPEGPATTEQTSGAAAHGSAPGHEFGDVVHENVQSGLQPEPAMLFAVPQSHCSPGSTVPFPHSAVTQMSFWHVPLFGHAVPFASGAPSSHFCPGEPPIVKAVHVLVPPHGSCVTQELGVRTHE